MHFEAKRPVRAALVGAALTTAALGARGAGAQDSLLIIGDSLSDAGRAGLLAPQLAPPAPYFWNFRYSNGPSYAELLPGLLGVSPDSVFNFAIGGARSGHGSPFPTGALDQVAEAVAHGAIRENGLAVYFIGANDLAGLIEGSPAGVTPSAHLATLATNIGTGIERLAAAGQRRFVLIDLPDLGTTPAVAGLGPAPAAQASRLAAAHNAGLRQLAARLGPQLGIEASVIGLHDLMSDIVERAVDEPGRYGIVNTGAPCILFTHTTRQPFPPRTTGACGDVETAAPDAARTALFWDPFHPTAAVHELAAEFIAANLGLMANAGAEAISRGTLGWWAARAQQRTFESRLAPSFAPQTAAPPAGAASPDGPTAYFAASLGSGDREGGARHRGFDYGVDTVTLGLEREIAPVGLVGAAVGQATGNLTLEGNGGRSDLRSVFAGVYGLLDQRDGDGRGPYAGAAAALSDDRHEMTRRTGFSPYPVASADPGGSTRSLLVYGGYDIRDEDTTYGPVLGGRWIRTDVDSYEEDAGPVSLTVDGQQLTSASLFAGGRIRTRIEIGAGEVVPHAQVVFERGLGGEEELGVTLPNGERRWGARGGTGNVFVVTGGIRFNARNAPLGAFVGGEAALPSEGSFCYGMMAQLSVRF